MLKKTIEYKDYNGVDRKEDFYFNLTEAEITEMEMSVSGGLAETIKQIVQTQDAPAIVKIFKDLVLKAYGVKSSDGKYFEKSDEIKKTFECSPAYSIIFMELATDADAAAKFVNGIIPAGMSKQVKQANEHPANN